MIGRRRWRRTLVVAAALGTATLVRPAAPEPAPAEPGGCGSCAFPPDEHAALIASSDTATLRGTALDRLEQAASRLRGITATLVRHADRRGVFALGLDAVERRAVLPLQRDATQFADPEWAHRVSLDLLTRFLDALHAELTGGAVAPHWAHYFALAADPATPLARTAMAGYNAHLTVDLAHAIAATGAGPRDARDHFRITDAVARHGALIVDRTRAVYGADLAPLWEFSGAGAALDRMLGAGVGSGALLRAAAAAANAVIFGNGLGLRNPAIAPAVRTGIDALWRANGAAFAAPARRRPSRRSVRNPLFSET